MTTNPDKAMQGSVTAANAIDWFLGLAVLLIGLLNLFLVHPVPGLVCLILSLVYLAPVNAFLKERVGFTIPRGVRIALGVLVIWFTLGVSDLGDMID